MTLETFPLLAVIVLLLPMLYFFITTWAFFLMKFDNPSVSWVMRALFNSYFVMMSIFGGMAALAFILSGQLILAVIFGLIAAVAVPARNWFLGRIDTQINARNAGDIGTAGRLRMIHCSGMAINAALLVALVASIPRLFGELV